MDGTGHKVFAPIFTCGISTILASSGLIPLAGTVLTTVLVSTVCSELTATLPDADLIALKPKPIIKGTAKKRYSKKYGRDYYYVTMSEQEFHRTYTKSDTLKVEKGGKGVYVYYDKCGTNNAATKYMALFFKMMGIKRHRGFQSHSPIIWVPIWLILILLAYSVTNVGTYIGCIVMGLGLGWISHLVGDLMTLDGLPLVPKLGKKGKGKDYHIAPLGGKIGKHRVFAFAKASNKIWIAFVCFIFINLFSYILIPDLFFTFWNGVYDILKTVLPVIGDILSNIWSFFMRILGSD